MNRLQIGFLSLSILLFIHIMPAIGQIGQPKTFLNDGSLHPSGFHLSPSLLFSSIDRASVSILELRAGIIFDQKFNIGPYAALSINDFIPQSETFPGIYMDYRSFGGFLEYTLAASQLVHATFPLKLGYGEIEMDAEYGSIDLDEANFFLVEPSCLLELNLHKHAKLNLGIGYRWVTEFAYRTITETQLTGIVWRAGLRFGIF